MSTKSALRADLDAEDRKTQAEDRKPPSRDTANSATPPTCSSGWRCRFPILGVQIGS